MPVKWYGSLLLIVLVGVVSIVYSRYERQHPVAGTPPIIGSKWYAAFAVDVCGIVQPNLAVNPNSAANPGIHTNGDGVIRIEPTKASDAGDNATLARFVADYPTFGLTSSSLTIPGERARTNGQTCPKQTPDVGRPGTIQIKVWPSAQAPGVDQPTTTTDPAGVKLVNGQLITVAFVPSGAAIPKPSPTAIAAMQQAVSQVGARTTLPATISTTTLPRSVTPSTVPPITSTTKSTGGAQPSK
jgi:hypothetical protein